MATVSSIPATNLGTPIAKEYFGLNINPGVTFPLAVPFGSYRFWDDKAQWAETNTRSGAYDWSGIDYWITNLKKQGIADGLYVLGGPPVPEFAEGNPLADLSPDGTGRNQFWRDWVAAVSQHFATAGFQIAAYEPWNEFVNPKRWNGTREQMLRLAEDARCIIAGRGQVTATKEGVAQVLASVHLTQPVSPASLITSPSFYSGADEQTWHEYYALPEAKAATEVVEYHAYVADPRQVLAQVLALAETVPAALPIWIGETSWGIRNNSNLTDQQKADFVRLVYERLPADQVARVYWYAANNGKTGLLLNSDGTLNLAGQAYCDTFGKRISGPIAA